MNSFLHLYIYEGDTLLFLAFPLQSLLDEKINEAHKLSTRIEDVESQLNKEQEDYKRL